MLACWKIHICDSIEKHFLKNQNENQLNTCDKSVLMRLNRDSLLFLAACEKLRKSRISHKDLKPSVKFIALNNWTNAFVAIK